LPRPAERCDWARATLAALTLATAGLPLSAQQRQVPVRALGDFRVELTAPLRQDVVSGRVELRAKVHADRPDEVLFVEFEVDGRVLFADAQAPYELIWNTREAAAHSIVARAFGPAGTVVEHTVETAAPPFAEEVFVSRVDQVEVYVHVDGRVDLGAADFSVLEAGITQPISAIDPSGDLPVAVGFMLDSSGSMVPQLGYAIDTAGTFIDGIMRQEQDKAFVMSFADLPAVLQQFTNDTDRLVTSLELISSGRHTRLYDSIVAAARQFEGHEGRRALVMLSDGRDSNSEARLAEAIVAAQRHDVAIYPVAVGLSGKYFRERWVLRQLADETGGEVFHLSPRDNPRRVYEQIARDLREQYRITYEPLNPSGDGGWREIEILLADPQRNKQRKLRTRPGYWAR